MENSGLEMSSNNELTILESTIDRFQIDVQNSITSENDKPIDCRESILKIESLVEEFNQDNLNDINSYSKLLNCCNYFLNFVTSLQQDIINVKKENKIMKGMKKILSKACLKSNFFEKKVLEYYDNLILKYKLIIEEKTNFIAELSSPLFLNPNFVDKEYACENKQIQSDEDLESIKSVVLPQIMDHSVQLTNLLCKINSLHESISNNSLEISKINDFICEQGQKNMDQQNSTAINILKLHINNLSTQLSEAICEKDEAVEELTAVYQELQILQNDHRNYQIDIQNVDDDIHTNLKTSDVNKEKLDTIKKIHAVEHRKGHDILNEMAKKITQFKKKVSQINEEIGRINGEIFVCNKQNEILVQLTSNMEKNFENNSHHTLDKLNSLTSLKEKLQSDSKTIISNAHSNYQEFTESQTVILNSYVILEDVLVKNSDRIKSYWKSIKQLYVNCNTYVLHFKNIEIREKKLMTSLLHLEKELKSRINDYKNKVKISQMIKYERASIIVHKEFENISKHFQEFQNMQSEILTHLDLIIIQSNLQNEFVHELEHQLAEFVPNVVVRGEYEKNYLSLKSHQNKYTADIEILIEGYNNIKTIYTDITVQNKVEKIQEFTLKKQNWEVKFKQLCDDLDKLDKEKNTFSLVLANYSTFINNICDELKSHYKIVIDKCQTEMISLTSTMEETQQKLNNLYEIKQALSSQLDTLISDKQTFVNQLRNEKQQLKDNISVLADDKQVLYVKLETITGDYFKLVGAKNPSTSQHKIKLLEIQDTRNNLKYVINLIQNLERNMEKELGKTIHKLHKAEESLGKNKSLLNQEMQVKHKLYLDIQDQIYNLRQKIQNVVNVKHKTLKNFDLIVCKTLELKNKNNVEKQNYNKKISTINCTKNIEESQNYDRQIEELQNEIKENEEDLDQQIKKITDFNSKLIEAINQVKTLKVNKNNLLAKVSNVKLELAESQQNYKTFLNIETIVTQEIEKTIFNLHKLNSNVKKYFLDRKEYLIDDSADFQNQLVLFITAEKRRTAFLKRRLSDIFSIKEYLNELSIEFYIHVNSFVTSNKNKSKLISQSIQKLKQREQNLEHHLRYLHIQKDKYDTQYRCIHREKDVLSKIFYNAKCRKDFFAVKESYSQWELEHKNIQDDLKSLKQKYTDEYNKLCENNNSLAEQILKLQEEIQEKDKNISSVETEITSLHKMYQTELDAVSMLEDKFKDIQDQHKNMIDKSTSHNIETADVFTQENSGFDNNFKDSECNQQIIGELKAQLWCTVKKYVDIKNENKALQDELNKYLKAPKHQNQSLVKSEKSKLNKSASIKFYSQSFKINQFIMFCLLFITIIILSSYIVNEDMPCS